MLIFYITASFLKEYTVYKVDTYVAYRSRMSYYKEPFFLRLIEAIKSEEIDLNRASKLLGVPYTTLYKQYKDTHGFVRKFRKGPRPRFKSPVSIR